MAFDVYEYKVIDTRDTGVPLVGSGSYHNRLARGLNVLGKKGWGMCAAIGTLIILSRRKPK